MIISGGVNIYPQEIENLLITHPKVGRRRGVRRAARGDGRGGDGGDRSRRRASPARRGAGRGTHRPSPAPTLAHFKAPRSIDFIEEMPRLPTGKLYKRLLKDQYWQGRAI